MDETHGKTTVKTGELLVPEKNSDRQLHLRQFVGNQFHGKFAFTSSIFERVVSIEGW